MCWWSMDPCERHRKEQGNAHGIRRKSTTPPRIGSARTVVDGIRRNGNEINGSQVIVVPIGSKIPLARSASEDGCKVESGARTPGKTAQNHRCVDDSMLRRG